MDILRGKRFYQTSGSIDDRMRILRGDGTWIDLLDPHHVPGTISLVSALSTGSLSLNADTSSGNYSVLWWDGTITSHASGATATKAVTSPAAGWANAPKPIRIFAETPGENLVEFESTVSQFTYCNVSGCTELVSLNVNTNQIDTFAALDCAALTVLRVAGNNLRTLDVRGMPLLVTLSVAGNELTALDVSNCTALETLTAFENQLTSLTGLENVPDLENLDVFDNALTVLDVNGNPALTYLGCGSNFLTSIQGLSGLVLLQELQCADNLFTSLDVSGLADLATVFAQDNATLTSVRAIGSSFSSVYYSSSSYGTGVDLSDCGMNAAALNQFFTDLDVPGVIGCIMDVSGNPGAATCTTSIANLKGYTVIT